MSAARTERLLNLLTLLLNAKRPVSLRALRQLEEFRAYSGHDAKSGERAFERDKAALLEIGVPLRWVAPTGQNGDDGGDDDGDGEGGYVVQKNQYYLPTLELSPSDMALLSIAGAAALGIEGFAGRNAVVRALAKLGFDADEEDDQARAPALAYAPLQPGIDAESHRAHLELLHDAVARRIRVVMTYRGADQRATQRELDPYGIYYRQGAWYVVGMCHLRQSERTFHIGRIETLKLVRQKQGSAFELPADFQLAKHVQRRPWEFPHQPPVQVCIRLAARWVPVATEIFGPNAEVQPTDDGAALVHVWASHPPALVAAVLPYGASAEVLAPAFLREELRRTYQQLCERYAGEAQGLESVGGVTP